MNRRKIGLLAIGGLLVLLTGSVYIFIPDELTISARQVTVCNVVAAFRSISNEDAWKKWWPEKGIDGYRYRIYGKAYPGAGVILEPENGGSIPGVMSAFSAGLSDSIMIVWQCRYVTSRNPFTRYRRYREAVRIRSTMAAGLSLLMPFLTKGENVYGMEIRNDRSSDSLLLVTQLLTADYPSTTAIYGAIHTMRAYISRQGAGGTDHPMLHVERRKDGLYESTVAIPVDRELQATKQLTMARFVPWKILIGEVRGGVYTAEQAMEQLQLFVVDNQKTPMAMPFQSLVTERDQEPDTSRWVTRVIQCVP